MCTPKIGHAGEQVGLTYSLLYAAPEVIAAVEAGRAHFVGSPAADVWALGVIAYELLTQSRALPRRQRGAPRRGAAAVGGGGARLSCAPRAAAPPQAQRAGVPGARPRGAADGAGRRRRLE
jgi:hypothetical protein